MSSREGTGRFHEPEVGSASGGHLTPDPSAGPLFDPLDAPLPSERARRGTPPPDRESEGGRGSTERTEAFPPRSSVRSGGGGGQAQRPESSTRQQVRRRTGIRRVRRTVRHVDPFSVLKLSGFFYAIFLLVWLLVVAVLYSLVDSMGLFDAAEDLGRGLVLWEEVNITLGLVEKWALLIGIVFGVVGTLVNTLLAVLYNVGSDLLGGLELTFVEKDS